MMAWQDEPKDAAVIRIDPAGAEAVLVASWVGAACPDLHPELVDSETVRFQYDGTTDPECRLRGLLSEDRFYGWAVSADRPPSGRCL